MASESDVLAETPAECFSDRFGNSGIAAEDQPLQGTKVGRDRQQAAVSPDVVVGQIEGKEPGDVGRTCEVPQPLIADSLMAQVERPKPDEVWAVENVGQLPLRRVQAQVTNGGQAEKGSDTGQKRRRATLGRLHEAAV